MSQCKAKPPQREAQAVSVLAGASQFEFPGGADILVRPFKDRQECLSHFAIPN